MEPVLQEGRLPLRPELLYDLSPQPQGRRKDTGCSDHLNYYYCQEESLLDHIFTRHDDQI